MSEETRKYNNLIAEFDIDKMFQPYTKETVNNIVTKLKEMFTSAEVFITDSVYGNFRTMVKKDLDDLYTDPEFYTVFFFDDLFYVNTREVLDGSDIWDYVFATLCERYPSFEEWMKDEETSELMYCAIADNEYNVCLNIEEKIREAIPDAEVLRLLQMNPHYC